MATKFNTQFAHSKIEPFECKTPSMTEQQFEFETNINNVVRGCVNSALPANTSQAMYGLTITGEEYQKSLDSTAEVMNYFEQLPVKAKDFFHYRPQEMLDFIKDDSNYDKAFDLGLIPESVYRIRKDKFLNAKQQENTPDVVTPEESGSNS